MFSELECSVIFTDRIYLSSKTIVDFLITKKSFLHLSTKFQTKSH